MLKKAVLDFFNYGLAEVNSSRSRNSAIRPWIATAGCFSTACR